MTVQTEGEPSTPNFAGIKIEAASGDFDMSRIYQSVKNGPHAEALAIDWAKARLNALSDMGDENQYTVTLVTQYFPCRESCGPAIDSRSWASDLQEAAEGRIDSLQFWHYQDNGSFRRIIPWG